MGKSSSWGEKEWGGAPLRRRKIGLCVKSLCQSSSQCYQSPAALGQGADNPPREFRGGNTSAGLEGGTGSSTRGFVPSMTLHLQRRKPGVCPDCGNWEKKLVGLCRKGCCDCKCSKNQCVPVSWALICSSVSVHRPCSSWRGLFGFQRNGRDSPEGLSLQNWGLLQYRQADEWNMPWKTQVKLYYTHHPPFRLFCLLLKRDWHWFLWKSAAKNPLWVQAEILGCTFILSHLSAQPLSAEILLLLGDLGSWLMQGVLFLLILHKNCFLEPWSIHRAALHGIQISLSCLLGFSLKTRQFKHHNLLVK